jgi:hypothetical protein
VTRASKEARTQSVRRQTLAFLAGCDKPMRTDNVSFAVVNMLDPRGEDGVETEHVRRMLEKLTAIGHVHRSRLRGRWYYEITDAGRTEVDS